MKWRLPIFRLRWRGGSRTWNQADIEARLAREREACERIRKQTAEFLDYIEGKDKSDGS